MQGWGEGLTLKDHIGFLIKEPPVSTMSEWCVSSRITDRKLEKAFCLLIYKEPHKASRNGHLIHFPVT